MSGKLAFFRFVAKAALDCVGFGIAGEFVAEVLPEMARMVHRRWAKDRPTAELRADVQAIVQADDREAHRLAAQAVAAEAATQPAGVQQALALYLSQLPVAVRRTQRRIADPSGRTVCPSLSLSGPADVLALLPPRLPHFTAGQRAAGFPDWELREMLGIGGFGEVWKAVNPHLASEPPVALKFCLDAQAARLLRNEVALLDRVRKQGRHKGIVALLDTALNSDPPCLKYEYVSGGDLTGFIPQWQERPPEEVVRWSLDMMRQLADILAFAHQLTPPIVHRDLKPANVLLAVAGGSPSRDERISDPLLNEKLVPKIADFGIGAIVAGQGLGTAATASRAGYLPTALRGSCTPLYASPQQLAGEEPHPRDDVFALGVLWFQMLTGKLTERPGTDWREDLAELPLSDAALHLMARCLAVRIDRRLPDAAALASELLHLPHKAAGVVPARTAAIVLLPAEPEEDEADEASDNPLDLAAAVQKSLLRAQATLSKALEMAEQQHDYSAAVKLLEGLPAPFRDNGLLDIYCERRDRVEQLRHEITAASKACRFAGLRDRIDELLILTPRDQAMRRLRDVVPWQPGPEVINTVGMRLMLIEPGVFSMGSPVNESGRQLAEGPVHEVEITTRFYMGAYPVTQQQYEAVVGTNPSHFRKVPGCDTRMFPVEKVSWEEAVAFCNQLSELPEEKRRGRSYRLPSEAEWEYACRTGFAEQTVFHFGQSLCGAQANFDGRHPYGGVFPTRGDYLQRTSAVGSYQPNPWGLYDMHGNVWEWCDDWFDDRYYRHSPRRDPHGPDRGEARVLRGGSWQNHARMCRSACRDWVGPGYHGFTVGFRVVLVVEETPQADRLAAFVG